MRALRFRLGSVVLIAAIVLPALILAGNAYLLWRQAWHDAQSAVGATADTAAEYALRVFEGHRLRLERVNDMLRGLSDDEIRANERDLHDKLQAFARSDSEPNAIAYYVFDRHARPLVSSSTYPVPRDQAFLDREFNTILRDPSAPGLHVSPIYSGSLNGKPYFAVTRRREFSGYAPPGEYDGIVSVSVYVDKANEALKRLLDQPDDVVALLRPDGYNLARSAGFGNAAFPVRIRPAGPMANALNQGVQRYNGIGAASLDGTQRQFALRRVLDWPVYALAARPTTAIAAGWRRAVVPQLLFGLPAWFALIALAWLVRRNQRELEQRVEERTAALLQGERRLRLAHEAAGIGYWEHDMVTRETRWSPEMYALYGLDPMHDGPMGHERYFAEIVHPDDHKRVIEAARHALETGRYECEYRVMRRNQAGGRDLRWILGRGVVVDGRRLLGANVDITARHEAEEQEAMLMREVDHRAKNVLAVVLSLLRLTPRADSALYASSVEGRVAAMARVHTLLAESRWIGAELQEIVEAELAAYASPRAGGAHPDRITTAGPSVRLAPHAAQAMSVVLHELATNAGKYGALSVPDGQVSILWRLDPDGTLNLEWSESGGPEIESAPKRQGFGSRLIDSTVRRQLGGEVTFVWERKGLRCIVVAPTAIQTESAPAPAPEAASGG